MAIPRILQNPRTLISTKAKTVATLNSQLIAQKPVENDLNPAGRHLVFLHGLFGNGASFQFLAKSKQIQSNFTVHLVDLRNHGRSEWSDEMSYSVMAYDLLGYLDH